ncbi:MAG: Transfer Agent [Rickettsiaceae bacterium]|jgi:SPP1 family predicted phage head-tail adaptor|nr:Transfer Agent [Rickettsiaceae bacterium]
MTNQPDISSRMRQTITFQSESTSSDSGGGVTLSWVDVSTVWAEIAPVTSMIFSSEKFSAGKIQGNISHIVTTRYLSGITSKMRILFGSRIFNIRSVININERSQWLKIYAEEGSGV